MLRHIFHFHWAEARIYLNTKSCSAQVLHVVSDPRDVAFSSYSQPLKLVHFSFRRVSRSTTISNRYLSRFQQHRFVCRNTVLKRYIIRLHIAILIMITFSESLQITCFGRFRTTRSHSSQVHMFFPYTIRALNDASRKLSPETCMCIPLDMSGREAKFRRGFTTATILQLQ